MSNIESRLLFILLLFFLIALSSNAQSWQTSNGNLYFNAGNIGIGTSSPSQKLEIENGNILVGNNYGLIFKNNADANDGTKIYRRSGNALGLSYAGNFLRFDALEDDPVIFKNSTDEVKVQIHPAGDSWFVSENVGIGTTNPSRKLHVNGEVRVEKNIGQITSGNHWQNGNHSLELYGSGGSDVVLSFHRGGLNAGAIKFAEKNGVTGLTLSANDDANDNQLFLKQDGRIGVGTTTPNAKLDVVGNTAVYDDFEGYSGFTNGNLPNGAVPTLIIRENTSGTKSPNGATYKGGLSFGYGGAGIYSVNPNPHGSANYGDLRFHTTSWDGSGFINTDRMVITRNGYIGLGTITPKAKMDVVGTTAVYDDFEGYSGVTNGTQPNGKVPTLIIRENTSGTKSPNGATYKGGLSFGEGGAGIYSVNPNPHGSKNYGDLRFHTTSWDGNGFINTDRMVITRNGYIGVGTISPTQKLSVNGKINAEEIILEDVSGADFVFEDDYDLLSLAETEQFIKDNKHLPEVPSAAEMAEEGLALKEMNILLLQKVEELTLHLIRMEKEAKTNATEFAAKLLEQEKQIEALKEAQNNH